MERELRLPGIRISNEVVAAAKEHAKDIQRSVNQWREDIHKNPELSGHEKLTSALIARTLKELGFDAQDVQTGVGGHGVVATLRGDLPGEDIVVLRADMDALPVPEKTGLEFKSLNPGKMHACGHDGHCAILLGAADVLRKMKQHIAGTVRFVFQPAEENGTGAKAMIEAGVLEGAIAVYGLHIDPREETRSIAIRPGPFFAAADALSVTFRRSNGDAAQSEGVHQSIMTGLQFVRYMTSISSRKNEDSFATVTKLNDGFEGINISPKSVSMTARIQIEDGVSREDIERDIRENAQRTQSRVRSIAEGRDMSTMIKDATVEFLPPDGNTFDTVITFNGIGGHAALRDKILNPIELCAPDMAKYLTDELANDKIQLRMTELTSQGGPAGTPAKQVELGATIRTFGGDLRNEVKRETTEYASKAAEQNKVTSEVQFPPTGVFPALDNPSPLPDSVVSVFKLAAGEHVNTEASRITASDDVAAFLDTMRERYEGLKETDPERAKKIEALYFLLGARPAGVAKEDVKGHHTPEFIFDPQAMETGVLSEALLVLNKLAPAAAAR